MKSFFFNSRTKRTTAFVVLWVWLFAMASGAANACLIQDNETNDYGSRVAHSNSSAADTGHSISSVHRDAIPDHDSGLETSKTQCLKVCDDESQSLPKQLVGFDLNHADLVPLIAPSGIAATHAVSERALAAIHRPPDPGLSIRIRLSRFAL
ncbi:MAG: hypothetical protein ABIR55_06930 [Burkholderiaceae bacterium]